MKSHLLPILGAVLVPLSASAAVSVSSQVITSLTLFPPADSGATDPQTVTACMGPAVFSGGAGSVTPTIYRNSEAEPYLSIDPLDPNHILVAYQQDRIGRSGGAVGLAVAYTFDGGQTWDRTKVPSTRCGGGLPGSGGDFERDTDPQLMFSNDGRSLFLSSIPFNITQDFAETYGITESRDGGRTWLPTRTLSYDPTLGTRNVYDFERIMFDPVDSNILYYIGQNYPAKGSTDKDFPFSGDGNKANQIIFSRSLDRGQSWEAFREIASFPPSKTHASDIARLPASPAHPQGVLLIPIMLTPSTINNTPSKSNKATLLLMRSFDQGVTWTQPTTIMDVVANADLADGGPEDPENGIFFSGGSFDIAVDSRNGYVYLSWLDARFDAPMGVAPVASFSQDGGVTWAAPMKISPRILTGAQVSGPNAMAVAADGTLGITSYDFRADKPGDATWDADVYLTLLRPSTGASPQLTFVDEIRLTDHSMDARQFITRVTIGAGFGGYFPGDYFGLAATGNDFLAVNTISNQNGTVPDSPVNSTVLRIDAVNHQDLLFSHIKR